MHLMKITAKKTKKKRKKEKKANNPQDGRR